MLLSCSYYMFPNELPPSFSLFSILLDLLSVSPTINTNFQSIRHLLLFLFTGVGTMLRYLSLFISSSYPVYALTHGTWLTNNQCYIDNSLMFLQQKQYRKKSILTQQYNIYIMTNFISSLLLILIFCDYGILHIIVSHQVAKIKAIFVVDFHLGLCCLPKQINPYPANIFCPENVVCF